MALADKQYKPKRTLHSMNIEFVQFVAFLSTPLTVNKIRIESNFLNKWYGLFTNKHRYSNNYELDSI